MTQRSGCRGKNRGVKENCDKEIVIFAVHDSGVKLTELNAWVKSFNGLSGPERVAAVRKKDGPKRRRLPNWKDDDTRDVLSGNDLLPGSDEFSDGGADKNTFVRPIN